MTCVKNCYLFIIEQKVGHISLSGEHLFLHMFLFKGPVTLSKEFCCGDGAAQPRDIYNRALKEYWFKFTTAPTQHLEKLFLQSLEELVLPTSKSHRRLMSPFPANMATAANPFFLLFQVFGVSYFFLGLMAIALENKLGPICCGASWKFIIGCTSENKIVCLFVCFFEALQTRNNIPFKSSNAFLPWHKKKTSKVRNIPSGTFLCAYAPTASIQEEKRNGDYALGSFLSNKVISVDVMKNLFESQLGIYCNDGSFPFSMARAKFSNSTSQRANCKFCQFGDGIWLQPVRLVSAGGRTIDVLH